MHNPVLRVRTRTKPQRETKTFRVVTFLLAHPFWSPIRIARALRNQGITHDLVRSVKYKLTRAGHTFPPQVRNPRNPESLAAQIRGALTAHPTHTNAQISHVLNERVSVDEIARVRRRLRNKGIAMPAPLSKSARIRSVFWDRPEWSPKQIAQSLKKFKVTAHEASMVKTRLRQEGVIVSVPKKPVRAVKPLVPKQPKPLGPKSIQTLIRKVITGQHPEFQRDDFSSDEDFRRARRELIRAFVEKHRSR